MKKNSVPTINEIEYKLFFYISIFKFVNIDFISKYIYPTKSKNYIYRRVQQLEYYDYLRGYTIYELQDNAIGNKIIVNSTLANDMLEYNSVKINKQKNVHLHYIKHQLAMADVMINYEEGSKCIEDKQIKIEQLLSENECSLSSKNINIRPDMGLILSVDDNNTLIFVEYEKRYASENEIKRKLIYQYSELRKYFFKLDVRKEYDVKNIRVLYVSEHEEKHNNLIRKAKKVKENISVDVLFTTKKEIDGIVKSGKNILELEYDSLYENKVKLYEKVQKD